MAVNYPVDPEELRMPDFEQWLDQFKPNQIVGLGCDGRSCPIAGFLKHQGYDAPFVEQEESRFGDISVLWPRRPSVKHPVWVREFIGKIDKHTKYSGQGIRARTVRRLLNEVIEEVGDEAA